MGCNFYLLDGTHIGKRSAAGLYCWDCKTSLCKGGTHNVHAAKSTWYDKCPECGKTAMEETLEESAAGRELGFNKSPPKPKTGVRSCSSFSWAIHPYLLRGKRVVDEYGRKYKAKEFRAVLSECPIMFYGSIGMEFS